MAARRRNYQNMDEILEIVTRDNDEPDDDIVLGDEESDMDSDWEYEEEPAVVFIPESHVHETEDVLESEENQTVTIAPPDVPLEQEETSAAGEEERHSENNDTDTEAGSPNSEDELLINLSKRPRVGRAPARLRGAPAARRGRRHAGRVRTRGGRVAAAREIRIRGGRIGPIGRGRLRGAAVAGQIPRNLAANRQNQRRPIAHWKEVAEGEFVNLKDFPFSEAEGLNVRMNGNEPLDFLNLYLTNEFWDLLVTETNRFAAQYFVYKNKAGPLWYKDLRTVHL